MRIAPQDSLILLRCKYILVLRSVSGQVRPSQGLCDPGQVATHTNYGLYDGLGQAKAYAALMAHAQSSDPGQVTALSVWTRQVAFSTGTMVNNFHSTFSAHVRCLPHKRDKATCMRLCCSCQPEKLTRSRFTSTLPPPMLFD